MTTGTLTRADLAESLHLQVGLSRADSSKIVEQILAERCGALSRGENVKISGFGNFQIRVKAPRPGRNPRTGEAIPIGARRVATFHASARLKEQIQGGMGDEAESSEETTDATAWRVGVE